MPQALIVLGVFLALAGIGSIAAGAPSWVLGLGLGTALIQSGAVGLVGGFLLVGIGFVLRALRDLTRRLDMIAPGAALPRAPVTPAPRPSAKREAVPAPSRREPPSFGRDDTRESAPLEREIGGNFDAEERGRPRSRFPAEPEPRMAPRPAATPERARLRPPAPERAPAFDEFADDVPPPSPPARHPASANSTSGMSTTIVRSGIIGGMAYTLYTDGSIEAELPIGTVRFASIEELQDHVSQTGEDADVDFGGSQPPRNEPLR